MKKLIFIFSSLLQGALLYGMEEKKSTIIPPQGINIIFQNNAGPIIFNFRAEDPTKINKSHNTDKSKKRKFLSEHIISLKEICGCPKDIENKERIFNSHLKGHAPSLFGPIACFEQGCIASFIYPDNLTTHLANHHHKFHLCCKAIFTDNSHYDDHLKRFHPKRIKTATARMSSINVDEVIQKNNEKLLNCLDFLTTAYDVVDEYKRLLAIPSNDNKDIIKALIDVYYRTAQYLYCYADPSNFIQSVQEECIAKQYDQYHFVREKLAILKQMKIKKIAPIEDNLCHLSDHAEKETDLSNDMMQILTQQSVTKTPEYHYDHEAMQEQNQPSFTNNIENNKELLRTKDMPFFDFLKASYNIVEQYSHWLDQYPHHHDLIVALFDTYYTIVETLFSHDKAQHALEVIESIKNGSKTKQYSPYICVKEVLTRLNSLKDSYDNHFSVVYSDFLQPLHY